MARLRIINIEDKKDNRPPNEFVRLKVEGKEEEEINLAEYAIVDKTFDEEGQLSNKYRHIYRFPNKVIKKGDFVRLYSGEKPKDGKPNFYANNKKSTTYVFYWNSNCCIWNNDTGDTAFLIRYLVVDDYSINK